MHTSTPHTTGLASCTNVQVLSLEANRITRIEVHLSSRVSCVPPLTGDGDEPHQGLEKLTKLRHLNAQDNLIKAAGGLRSLSFNTKLEELQLQGSHKHVLGTHVTVVVPGGRQGRETLGLMVCGGRFPGRAEGRKCLTCRRRL